ncbi:hypothetical protein NBRC3257_3208 [Gluconobacter thailandicus NBRC 3257]|uniref:Uncharacterized protein n=1 Tax=Gluconobacter thailandicus NBRC 3257 TaxID=1381097 RepID=A0ABQ0J1B4_GLUTH|nr:hypothetical protein NBRC3255_3097 [Gluconobacter thailandicus NBRC 3255]GAD28209.1 hypothetical protein NBRC3257_3208 [Gluconobacter thailandicus NBRC 3257]
MHRLSCGDPLGKRVAIAPSVSEDESDAKGWRLHRTEDVGIAPKRVVIAP